MDTKPATEPNGHQPAAIPSAPPLLANGQNSSANSPQPPKPRVRGIMQTNQAANLQRLAYDAGMALRSALTVDGEMTVTREDAMALAQLVRAWDTAADRLRVLKGKGLPAAVKSKGSKGKGHFEAEIIQAPQPEPLKAAAN